VPSSAVVERNSECTPHSALVLGPFPCAGSRTALRQPVEGQLVPAALVKRGRTADGKLGDEDA
jgi:hypothetical protein